MAAKFLHFHRLPCSRCLCRHAELLNSLLVALKICCFVQVELSQLVLPECLLVLACAEEDIELPGLLFPPVWLHSCLSSLPPPGPVREEPHFCHLCSCAELYFYGGKGSRTFSEHFLSICHISCAVSEVGKKLSGSWEVSLLRARGIANCRNVLGHYRAQSKDLQLRDQVQQPLLLTLSRPPRLP